MAFDVFKKKYPILISKEKDIYEIDGQFFILLLLKGSYFVMKVPEVWVMSLRSGCNKTNFVPEKDTVKLGLKNGKMHLQSPQGLVLRPDYKPSFDTKVILAHALGNAIIAGILKHFDKNNKFVSFVEKKGLALAHWHGYFHPEFIPNGLVMHGLSNPQVSCSSPQSAIYALEGKLLKFNEALKDGKEFFGDVHVEPHHGTNIIFPSLVDLADYLTKNGKASVLGNKYLDLYDHF
jgi:hypothetical protein